MHRGQPFDPTQAFTLAETHYREDDDIVKKGRYPVIDVTNWGWELLYEKFIADGGCPDIGPNVNYKMQFLGGLLLHKVL